MFIKADNRSPGWLLLYSILARRLSHPAAGPITIVTTNYLFETPPIKSKEDQSVFTELMPLLAGRTLLLTVAKVDDKTLRVNVIPAQAKADENPALTTPLTYTGLPEELDAELGKHLAGYVQTHQLTASTLAEAKATMEAAAKAAQEEAKRKAEERKKAAPKAPDKTASAPSTDSASANSVGPTPPAEGSSNSAPAGTPGLFGPASPETASTQPKGGLAL
jgi:PRTRC genetic system protein E